MVVLFVFLTLLALLGGAGLWLLSKPELKQEWKKTPDHLNEDVPLEDIHSIVKHKYVASKYDEAQVLAQVECICGWSDATGSTEYAQRRGEQHVNNERERVQRERNAARAVALKLAENEKGDFAW